MHRLYSLKNDAGKSALDHAKELSWRNIFKYLEKYKNKVGDTMGDCSRNVKMDYLLWYLQRKFDCVIKWMDHLFSSDMMRNT